MSGFPWGWLLISAGVSLIYSDKVTKWFERKKREDDLIAYLQANGVAMTAEDLAYLGSNGTFVLSPVAPKSSEHEDAPLTPLGSISSSSSTPSGSEGDDEDSSEPISDSE